MAFQTLPFNPVDPQPGVKADNTNYRSVYNFLNQYYPDYHNQLILTHSKGSLRGFTEAMANEEMFSADRVYWSEDGERHVIHEGNVARAGNVFTLANHRIRPGVVIKVHDATNDAWAGGLVTATTANTFTASPYRYAAFNNVTDLGTANLTVYTAGSEFQKGSDLQQASLEEQLDFFNIKPSIKSETYQINNSDLTEPTWFEAEGQYYWNLRQIDETEERFKDELEAHFIEGESASTGAALDGTGTTGTPGYFESLRTGGATFADRIRTITDWQSVSRFQDRVRGERHQMLFVNREQNDDIDLFLAGLNKTEQNSFNFGVFANRGMSGENVHMQLGFEGFVWGGRQYSKQLWKYLIDPVKQGSVALAASGKVQGVMFPYGTTPIKNQLEYNETKYVPYLTIMYRGMTGYDRRYRRVITGSGPLSNPTTESDFTKVTWSSEGMFRVAARRKQIIITG